MKKTFFIKLFVVVMTTFLITSCGPYKEEQYEQIEPNETAFVIPLEEGTDDQTNFKSEQYLQDKMVATKRIYIPLKKHSNGRMPWSYKYIPIIRVIRVDRAPITREWTESGATGTNSKKEDIEVESRESIGFGIGITVTASIPEEWAAKFLYNYNGRTLADVMDYNVRSYIQDLLTGEFGKRDLTTCQNERSQVFEIMKKDVAKHFKTKGIRIDNIGAAGQFNYLEPAIQEAINAKFTAEMKVEAAKDEVKAAKKFAQAKSAIEAQKKLDAEIKMMEAQAEFLIGVGKGKVKLPTYLVIGGTTMDLLPAIKK